MIEMRTAITARELARQGRRFKPHVTLTLERQSPHRRQIERLITSYDQFVMAYQMRETLAGTEVELMFEGQQGCRYFATDYAAITNQ